MTAFQDDAAGVVQKQPRFFLGWMVVLAGAMVAFSQTAFFNPVLGVFIPALQKDFGWSRTDISLAVTCGALFGAAMTPFFGPLIDKRGGRVFVTGGGFILALALVGVGLMQAKWQFFILFAIGRGMAAGMITLAVSVTVSKWFIRRRGFAVGIMSLGSRFGFAVLPVMIQLVIAAFSWRVAAFALAGSVMVFGILPAIWWLHPHPEPFGLEPDGDAAPHASSALTSAQREINWTHHDAVRTRAFWLLTLAVSVQACCTGAINLHQIPYLIDRGLSSGNAALVAGVFAASSGAGALLEGVLDSKLGARWTMVIGLVGSALGVVILINVHSAPMGYAYGVCYGLTFGLMVTSSQIVFADYFGRRALGAIRGTSAPFQMGLNAIGPLLAGISFDATGSYLTAFIPFAISYVAAAIAVTIARPPVAPSPAEA